MSEQKEVCGIVMPISAMDDCSESHWSEVLEVISDSVDNAGFDANLVSNADDVGLIHKRIIQNLYDNPIVVCDVSCKNANVMFELGLRLAFDKPTIIIKDDQTSYSFDTSAIEHIEYPRDMRFSKIVEFKQKLSEKIKATFEISQSDPSHTTFLKHFGEFKVAKLDKKEVSGEEFIIEELKNIRTSVQRLEYSGKRQDELIERGLFRNSIRNIWTPHAIPEPPAPPRPPGAKTLEENIMDNLHAGWKKENIIEHYVAQGHSKKQIIGIIDALSALQIT